MSINPPLTPLTPDGETAAASVETYLAELGSARSRRRMHSALGRAGALLVGAESARVDPATVPWWELQHTHVVAVRSALEDAGSAPSSINVVLSALRGVARACWLAGRMSAEVFHRVQTAKNIKATRQPAGRSLSQGELGALFASCAQDTVEGDLAGARDGGIMALLYMAGLRCAEVSALELGDVDLDTGEVRVRSGKGNRDRTSYIQDGGLVALRDWVQIRGTDAGPMWGRIRRGGHPVLPATGLSSRAIEAVCAKRAEDAGIAAFTPHDLRRTFVSALLHGGVDLLTVQQLAGHVTPMSTARYDRRGEAAKQKAIGVLHVAYRV